MYIPDSDEIEDAKNILERVGFHVSRDDQRLNEYNCIEHLESKGYVIPPKPTSLFEYNELKDKLNEH